MQMLPREHENRISVLAHLSDVGVCYDRIVETMRENIADVGFNQRRREVPLDEAS